MAYYRGQPQKQLRLLCFGDSLTAGYSEMGSVFHPYESKMSQMLAMAFPDISFQTDIRGISGDTVSRGYLKRMEACFPSPVSPPSPISPPTSPRKSTTTNGVNGSSSSTHGTADKQNTTKPYDWVIVLGGTNDLGWGFTPEEIFAKLKAVWDIPLKRGAKVLALTVPECAVATAKARERMDAKRDVLNGMIKGYKRDNYYVYDLHTAVPYYSMSEKDRAKHWDDHLHFTPDGYDLIGNKVGMALVSLLVKQRVDDLPPAKRRRVFKDDEKVFEEETGDPNALDGGYIVVRRTDLD
ncbi:SGNH hydrolase-type esterase domain-containing protein [Podospora australis]|uniref:SGNH hydrolase-type esterase domain-containing protein n=1 Tax=Podospora australis TaxID=1536484 RepID=A0AAN7AKQ2_9PEZI|nr:SGNH hydrolase-type esterase domain-containing protein [Podospora australis]